MSPLVCRRCERRISLPHKHDDEIKIERAIEIEEGKTYVVELNAATNPEQLMAMSKLWRETTKSRVMFLTQDARLARIGEDEIKQSIIDEIEEDCQRKWDGNHRFYDCEMEKCWHIKAVKFLNGEEL